MRSSTPANQLERSNDLDVLLHLVLKTDLLADDDLIRRDVDLFPVYQNMPVPHKLPCLRVGCRETQAHENVVQPSFELCEQMFAGNALLTDRLLKISAELVLQHSVDAFHLLFFTQLQSVSNDLRFTITSVLTGRKISLFDPARRFKTALAFQK